MAFFIKAIRNSYAVYTYAIILSIILLDKWVLINLNCFRKIAA